MQKGLATCEQASPHFSYWSRRSAPEGGSEGRGEGGRDIIWTHLECPGNPNESCACNRSPRGTPRGREVVLRCQGCPPPPSPSDTVEDRGSGCCGSVWASRWLQVTSDKWTHTHTQPWWVMQASHSHSASAGWSMTHFLFITGQRQVSSCHWVSTRKWGCLVLSVVKLNLLGYTCEVF